MSLRWQDFTDRHPRLAGFLVRFRACLPPLNFITIHYAYFIAIPLVSSVIFWGSSDPSFSISYTDSLFLVVSAMTEAGLNTVNLSQMTTWQQVILFLLIVLGSSIWVSIWTVAFRKHVFEQRFDAIVAADRVCRSQHRPAAKSSTKPCRSLWSKIAAVFQKTSTQSTGTSVLPMPAPLVPPLAATSDDDRAQDLSAFEDTTGQREVLDELQNVGPAGHTHLRRGRASSGTLPSSSISHVIFADSHADAGSSAHRQFEIRPVRRAPTKVPLGTSQEAKVIGEEKQEEGRAWTTPTFLTNRTVGRNSQFHGLTREEREQLGGCEYRALKLLSIVVPLYFFLWQFLGCISLGAWINNNMADVATSNGINAWWLGIFSGASAFNNSGMSLLDANMIPFEGASWVVITMGLLILAGNTAYPVFLRLIFWGILKLLRSTTGEGRFSNSKTTIEFILKYPRRVYTNLFPARATWWLLFMIILLNCIDWAAFELLNLGNPFIEKLPPGSRVLDGLFQAIAVRNGGFYIVPLPNVFIGLQVLYVIMMYISVYPVVITMRHSNVYEERSLGIYSDYPGSIADLDSNPTNTRNASMPPARELGRALRRIFIPWHGVGVVPPPATGSGSESRISFISQQIHGQLAHDLWWLVLAVLIITTIETSHFLTDPVSYSVFNVIFEVVSAYGCVGISVGAPSAAYSFSGSWHSASKLTLCLVMLRGRHRGLPVALDRAVRLPGEQLHRDEEEDYRIHRSITSRRINAEEGMLLL